MSLRVAREELIAENAVVAAPVADRLLTEVDRTFELPGVLLLGYFGLFLAYLGVMAVGFPSPDMVMPMAIFVTFIIAAAAVPMAWLMVAPETAKKALRLDQLSSKGIMTETGRCSAGAASVQVLILPVLVFLWGIAATLIAALV